MSSSREKTQADFDLDRIIDILDEAIMSTDPRVKECLSRLMVIVALTRSDVRGDPTVGPFRQLFNDMHNINRRVNRIEDSNHRDIKIEDEKRYQQTIVNNTKWYTVKPTTGTPPITPGHSIGDFPNIVPPTKI